MKIYIENVQKSKKHGLPSQYLFFFNFSKRFRYFEIVEMVITDPMQKRTFDFERIQMII
jgi:hypothetical protein